MHKNVHPELGTKNAKKKNGNSNNALKYNFFRTNESFNFFSFRFSLKIKKKSDSNRAQVGPLDVYVGIKND